MAIRKASVDRRVRGAKERKLEDHIVGKVGITEQSLEKDIQWEATKGEVHSDVRLEDDTGHGKAVIIRAFDFQANPEAFRSHVPSKQELFSAHREQIVGMLYADQLKIYEDVEPRVIISKNKRNYRIVVAGLPWGMSRASIPTLSEIANKH